MKKCFLFPLVIGIFFAACEKKTEQPLAASIPGINGDVYAFAIYNGNLIAGGNFTKADKIPASNVALWNGSAWNSFGSGLNKYVNTLITYKNYLIAGCPYVGVFDWDGTTWNQLISGTDSKYLFTIYNNNLVVAGNFDTIGGIVAKGLAQWNGTSWLPIDTGSHTGITSITIYNGNLTVGGLRLVIDGKAFNGIAQWNGTSWSALGNASGFSDYGPVIFANNGYLYVNGPNDYSFYADTGWTYEVIGQSGGNTWLDNFGVYNGNTIATMSSGISGAGPPPNSGLVQIAGSSYSYFPSPDGAVAAIIQYQNNLIIGGSFTSVNNISVMNIAQWNGSTWSAF